LTKLIRFHEKARKHFLLQNLQKYHKKKGSESYLIFEANLEKKLTPKNKLFPAKQDKKKKKKKKNIKK